MPMVKVNGVDLSYESAGPPRAPAVIFSHSVGSTRDTWDAQFAALSDRYRCIRYDLRGHGLSGSVDEAIEIEDLATDLAGLLDALEIESAHIVGLSIGGMLNQAFAIAYPERVKSLSLVSTTAHLPPPERWQTRAATVRADGMAAVVDEVIPLWFSEAYRAREPIVIEGYRERFKACDPTGYARCCEAIGKMDLRERISAITAPTLIVVGSDDPATTPAMAEDLRERIAGSEMVVISGAFHIVSVERAEAVTAHLTAFLGRHAPEASGKDFDRGVAVRRSVLGDEHVDRALDDAGDFGAPWQDFVTRIAWGEIWGDPTLPRKTRSLVTLAMMIALHREEEFKLHVRPALNNGVTTDELRALAMQAAIYGGVPAANAAFRWLREVLGEELQ